jgi:ABC-type polysaccharide/polyol phosphate transport system ATPase subunit
MRANPRPVSDPIAPPMATPVVAPEPQGPPSDDVVLRAENVGKRFDIYPNDRSRFFEFLGSRSHHREHWAVRAFELEVRRGRAIGVIGNNGAGKSTLLRLLAGITEPTEGAIQLRGRLSALLDLGVGFQEGFTGRENIEFGCQLLGLRPAQIEARLPDMIRFAELGEFIDDPVRTYSSGMALRLGFAMAVHVDAELLLIDEVLAVGDQYFQRKCIRKISALLEEGTSLVLVTHDLHAVRALCSEVLWFDAGRVRMRGPAREVVAAYLDQDRLRSARARAEEQEEPLRRAAPQASRAVQHAEDVHVEADADLHRRLLQATQLPDAAGTFAEEQGAAPRLADGENLLVSGTGEVRILRVQLTDQSATERPSFQSGESLVVAVTFRTTERIEDPIFGVALFRNDGTYVYGPNTGFDRVLAGAWHGVYTVFIHYPALPLLEGSYRVSVAVYDSGHVRPMAWHNQLYEFEIAQSVDDHGLVRLPHRWGMIVHHDETGTR